MCGDSGGEKHLIIAPMKNLRITAHLADGGALDLLKDDAAGGDVIHQLFGHTDGGPPFTGMSIECFYEGRCYRIGVPHDKRTEAKVFVDEMTEEEWRGPADR